MQLLAWTRLSPIALLLLLLVVQVPLGVSSFQIFSPARIECYSASTLFSSPEDSSWGGGGGEEEDDDFEILFEDTPSNLDVTEKAWRYAKKPLLSIGAKGASFSHGNSLRQLLDAHTIVKVKVNTNKFGKRCTEIEMEIEIEKWKDVVCILMLLSIASAIYYCRIRNSGKSIRGYSRFGRRIRCTQRH